MGYEYCHDKFTVAGLTSECSVQVAPDKIVECPLQIEAAVQHIRIPEHTPFMAIVEVKALMARVKSQLRRFTGLGAQIHQSSEDAEQEIQVRGLVYNKQKKTMRRTSQTMLPFVPGFVGTPWITGC